MASHIDVAQLIGEIYDAALTPERWPGVLEDIGDAFGGSACLLGVQNLPHGIGFAATARIDPHYLPLFRSVYADPRMNAPVGRLLSRPVGVPLLASKLHDRHEFTRTEVYNDLMCPQKLQDGAIALLLREPDHCVIWAVMPSESAEPLGERDEQLLHLLTPHLQRSAQLLLRLGALDARAQAAEEVLDRVPHGVGMLDAKSRVLRLNRAAEAIVASGDGFWIGRDGLRAATYNETRALRRLISEAAATGVGDGTGGGGAMSLSRPSGGQPLSVLAAPFRGERLASGSYWPAAIVFIANPDQNVVVPSDLLRHLYGLTRAEAGLAAILLQGKNLSEAAAELGVTMSTVRTQLRYVFDKTGARRQAELVRILLRGPAGLLLSGSSGQL